MSTTTTANRVPHTYEDDSDAPGCCTRCRLPAANRIHDLPHTAPRGHTRR